MVASALALLVAWLGQIERRALQNDARRRRLLERA